jgi:hypothetical protein
MRFEVLTVINMLMLIFWTVMLCEPAGRYKYFGETYYSLHSITAQKTNIYIICVVNIFNSGREFHAESTKSIFLLHSILAL